MKIKSLRNNAVKIGLDLDRRFDNCKNQKHINKNPINTNQKIFSLKILPTLILLSIFFLFSTIAFAIPNSLTLQGKLTSLAGVSQQGTFNFTFKIYDAATAGNALWSVINQSVTTDANGVYDVILSGINLSFADQYYIGIAVQGENESVPRINLTSAPYTFRANTSEALNPNASYFVTNLSVTGNATIGTGSSTLTISTLGFNLTTIGNIFAAGNLSIAGNTFFINSLASKVGINTTTPANTLTVQGTLNVSNPGRNGDLFVASSGNVGIGTTAPSYLLTVANATNAVNLSGVLYINGSNGSSGRVSIGNAPGFIPNSLVSIGSSLTFVSDGINTFYVVVDMDPTITVNNNLAVGIIGYDAEIRVNGSGKDIANGPPSGGSAITSLFAEPIYSGSGSAVNVIGVTGIPIVNSGNVTNLIGLFGQTNIQGSGGTVNNSYGGYFDNNLLSAGTLNNSYGVYIKNQTNGNNKYNLYVEGGPNYFGGNVGIGTTSPSQKLEISGGNILVNNTANAFLNLSGPIMMKSGSDIVISD